MKRFLARFRIPLALSGIALLGIIIAQTNTVSLQPQHVIEPAEAAHKVKEVPIESGTTFSTLMAHAGVATSTHAAILAAAEDVSSLSKIVAGRIIQLFYNPETDELEKLVYPLDTQHELVITKTVTASTTPPPSQTTSTSSTIPALEPAVVWVAKNKKIDYDIEIAQAHGTIQTSLFEAALAQGTDERAIIAFADVFQWTVDFAWDTREGDEFFFIYERRYRDGEYVMPGKILAAKIINNKQTYQAYYFEAPNGEVGYYDEEGKSVQRIFLKAPVEFKYISSGYTSGARYVSEALGWSSSHKAIDYAANTGTPVRAVGDGTVISAGWNGGYGNFIAVRHNSTYTTNYAHLSKLNVKRGQKVTQGQVIGAVGSTGRSTGPHLHYEMVKYGTKINPLREVFPANDAIDENYLPIYRTVLRAYQPQIIN